MAPSSNLPARPRRQLRFNASGTSAHAVEQEESEQFLDRPGFQQRPLQVTWEMTQACDWKSAGARAAARTARDRNQFSTAVAFHLDEEVAAMHGPLVALT